MIDFNPATEPIEVLKHFTRKSSKPELLHYLLTRATTFYWLNQVFFLERSIDREDDSLRVAQVLGPIDWNEYCHNLGELSRKKGFEDLVRDYNPEQDKKFKKFVGEFKISLDRDSIFKKVTETGQSYLDELVNYAGGTIELGDLDKQFMERFGEHFVLLTLKGENDEVIGMVYGNRNFSHCVPTPFKELDQEAVKRFDPVRYPVAACLCILRKTEEVVKEERADMREETYKGIAHEMRNPLTAINGLVNSTMGDVHRMIDTLLNSSGLEGIAGMEIPAEEKIERILKIAHSEREDVLNRLGKLNELLSVVYSQGRKLESLSAFLGTNAAAMYNPTKQEFYVEDLLNRMPTLYKCEVSLAAERQKVFADPNHVDQIMQNLIKNANEAEATANIRVKYIDHVCAISVYNSSHISEDTKPMIFEPFFTTKKRGTGLGLALSKQLAEKNGGKLYLHYSSQHEGTCFVLELPMVKTSHG